MPMLSSVIVAVIEIWSYLQQRVKVPRWYELSFPGGESLLQTEIPLTFKLLTWAVSHSHRLSSTFHKDTLINKDVIVTIVDHRQQQSKQSQGKRGKERERERE